MSTFIVDSLMLYCCKKKKRYKEDKFAFTKDYAKDPKIFLNPKHRLKSEDEETEVQPGASSIDGVPSPMNYDKGNMYGRFDNNQTNRFNI